MLATLEDENHEDDMLTRLATADLLERLDECERGLVLGYVRGEDIPPLMLQRLGYVAWKLAVLAGTTAPCEKCDIEKPAKEFASSNFRLNHISRATSVCVACETENQRYNRMCVARWNAAIRNGETWECSDCGLRPATAFHPLTRNRCHACTVRPRPSAE